MIGILIFILVLGVLVFVHELGHFFVARQSGIAVEEFGFGFPPRIVGIKRGNTVFSLNWIPFGGFVRMQGEQEDAAARPDSFVSAHWSKQVAVLLAGVTMNFLFAWLVLTVTFVTGVSADPDQYPQDRYQQRSAITIQAVVSENFPAAQSGLPSGAEIVSINGVSYTSTEKLIEAVQKTKYPKLTIVARSQGAEKTYVVEPKKSDTKDEAPRYGLGLQPVTTIRYPGWVAPWYGLRSTVSMLGQTFAGLGTMVNGLFHGKVSQDLTGPIGIAVLTNEVRQFGVVSLLQFMAFLSISLAALNILPLPALDGGRTVFVLWSAITKRPVSQKAEAIIHAVGFYGLLLMVVLISIRDVRRFNIVESVLQLFGR